MSLLHGILLTIFGGTCICIMLLSSRKRIGIIQYPFLATVVMLGWVFPQLIGLSLQEQVPDGAVTKTVVFTLFCLLAACFGYWRTRRSSRVLQWQFSPKKLNFAAAVLSLAGAFFFLKVTQMAEEARLLHGGLWTGVITIYVFLAGMLTTGLVIAAISYIHKPSWMGLGIMAFGLLFHFHRVIVEGRREEMIQMFVFLALFIWLRRGWLPPRVVLLGTISAGAFLMTSIGDYRNLMLGSGSTYREIDWISNFVGSFQDLNQSSELYNAAMIIEATDLTLKFDLGLSLWNSFVHAYVPAQVFGADFKNGLRFELVDVAAQEFGHRPHTGTTLTGMAGAFRSYWWLGCIVYLIIGIVMKRWFLAASHGLPAAQMIVILITPKSLLAITHNTNAFFLEFVNLAAFLLPALLFALHREKSHTPLDDRRPAGLKGS
jgi:hypothetical protein